MPKIKRNEQNKFSEEKKVIENYLNTIYKNSFDQKVLETKPKEDSFLEVSISEGKFLELLVRIKNPKRILEIGTFRGFSAYFLSRYLQNKPAKLWSIEKDEKRFTEIESLWKKLKIDHNTKLLKGDAISILKKLQKQKKKFDLFFIDARKQDTKVYFSLCYSLASPKAIMVVDNTLWGGEVALKDDTVGNAARAMREFNQFLVQNYPQNTYIIPAWDGITIVIKT